MKIFLIVTLSLLLVVMCVVYFRYEHPQIPRRAPVAMSIPAVRPLTHRASRLPASKPGPTGPVDISGPLRDRDLVSWVLPEYPEWAQEQGVMGTYKVKIRVTPVGDVRSFTEPQLLSADPRLDERALEAIRQWKFVEMPNSFGDQWGIITVRFALLFEAEEQSEASIHGIALGKSNASGVWECVRRWLDHGKTRYAYICKPRPRPDSVAAPVLAE